QQRHDQRNDGHLQRVEPQGADEAGNTQHRGTDVFSQSARERPKRQPDDQGAQRPIGAETSRAPGRRLRAQRGFLNLKTKRSVLPRILGSNTSRLWSSAGLRSMSLVATSWKPARLKSAFTVSGS